MSKNVNFASFANLIEEANESFINGNIDKYNESAKNLNDYIGWQALRYLTKDNEHKDSRKKTRTTRKS
jgi:hypothetical protein